MEKKSFEEIKSKIAALVFKEKFDLVVAIGRGGVVPGYLIAQRESLPFYVLGVKWRNDRHEIVYPSPQLYDQPKLQIEDKTVLVADDVSRTGATLNAAKGYLVGAREVKTFVINGQADYSLYSEECFKMPWLY